MFLLVLFASSFAQSQGTLLEWVEQNGGFVNRERISIGESNLGGHGLFMKPCLEQRSCDPDPLLLELPYSIFFHPFSLHLSPEVSQVVTLLEREFHSSEREVIFENLLHCALVLEMRNESSFFRPYFLSMTPLPNRFGILLDEDDLGILMDLGDRHGIVRRIKEFRRMYEYHRTEFNRISHPFPMVTDEEYFMACVLTGSRSFGQFGWTLGKEVPLVYKEKSVPILIPLFDLVNHHQEDPSTNRYYYNPARAEGVEYTLKWWPTLGGEPAQRELFIAYHTPFTTPLISFTHYGFVVPNVQISLDYRDPLESVQLEEYLSKVESALKRTKNPVMFQYLKEVKRATSILLFDVDIKGRGELR